MAGHEGLARSAWGCSASGWANGRTAACTSRSSPPSPTAASACSTSPATWDAFQNLAADHTGDVAERQERLHRALDLVRGRPFSGIYARRYSWSEDIVQEIITAVVRVAGELADLRLRESDGRGALWAATRGLRVAREAEQLWRQRFRAHALLGEERELEAAIRSMEAMLLDLGYAMEAETSDTLRLLQMAKR
ncbi:bacterial transcriptional activator domain-containing protein [Streptomyces albidoflavus]|uniref:hypothetical protein n=1 Tax=Streptomyces albidoflavus TaxID=1886 RepID=UPI0030885D0E|nr:bacterial transcriptional activator domain-containing protein [Streptomyces albidoflavus]WSB24126.1 bacterial transcriptional activator domain-containing protein [Streptomyces albidoflavus]